MISLFMRREAKWFEVSVVFCLTRGWFSTGIRVNDEGYLPTASTDIVGTVGREYFWLGEQL